MIFRRNRFLFATPILLLISSLLATAHAGETHGADWLAFKKVTGSWGFSTRDGSIGPPLSDQAAPATVVGTMQFLRNGTCVVEEFFKVGEDPPIRRTSQNCTFELDESFLFQEVEHINPFPSIVNVVCVIIDPHKLMQCEIEDEGIHGVLEVIKQK